MGLAAVPPPSRKIRLPHGTWALAGHSDHLPQPTRLTYPTIQNPNDPSQSIYPTMTISYHVAPHLYVPRTPRVGVWDEETGGWDTEGVTDVTYDATTGCVTFRVDRLGTMALLRDRAAFIPYESWHLRPSMGRVGKGCVLTVYLGKKGTTRPDVNAVKHPLEVAVGEGTVKLLDAPVPALEPLIGVEFPPPLFVEALGECGLTCAPFDHDAYFVNDPLEEALDVEVEPIVSTTDKEEEE